MKYPQTFAIDVAKNINAIGKYGCLAMCYLYCIGIDPEVESYVKSSMPKDGDVDKKKKELIDRVDKALIKLIKEEINQECGVATCESLLDGIEKQVDLFLGEMQDEVKLLKEDTLPKMQASLELAKKDLVELDGKFFKKKSDLEDYDYILCMEKL